MKKFSNTINKKKTKKLFIFLSLLIFLIFIISNSIIIYFGSKNIEFNANNINYSQYIVILGTSKMDKQGKPNFYFINRIRAGAKLYKEKKGARIIVTGAKKGEYDEPSDMKKALISYEIPSNSVIKDNKGYRTFESLKRLKNHYKVQKCIFVTDNFHLPRTLILAKILGINAIGFPSEDVPKQTSSYPKFRELFARVKCLKDLVIAIFLKEKFQDGQKK